MAREEAIAILDGFKHNPLFNEQHFEALDMAISALSENKFFDGMTNGEVIQALFPNVVIRNDDSMLIKEVLFTSEMWNAPYQKGGE